MPMSEKIFQDPFIRTGRFTSHCHVQSPHCLESTPGSLWERPDRSVGTVPSAVGALKMWKTVRVLHQMSVYQRVS